MNEFHSIVYIVRSLTLDRHSYSFMKCDAMCWWKMKSIGVNALSSLNWIECDYNLTLSAKRINVSYRKKSADTFISLYRVDDDDEALSLGRSLEKLAHSRTIFLCTMRSTSPKKISHMLNQLRSMKKCYVRKNLTRWSVYLYTRQCAKLDIFV